MLTADQAHHAVTRAWRGALASLAVLDPPRWSGPTRCAGWTVLDLARHAAWGVSMEADALRRARTGEPGSGEGTEPDAAAPEVVLAALHDAVDALDDELARAGALPADTVVTIPFGPVPLGFALDVFTMEAGVHADDVADALAEVPAEVPADVPAEVTAEALARDRPGDPPALDPDVVAATVAVLVPVLPALAAMAGDAAVRPPSGTVVALDGPSASMRFAATDAGWEPVPPGPDAPTPTATVTGDDTAVLRFALGRTGAEDPRLRVAGAEEFKRWFPGP